MFIQAATEKYCWRLKTEYHDFIGWKKFTADARALLFSDDVYWRLESSIGEVKMMLTDQLPLISAARYLNGQPLIRDEPIADDNIVCFNGYSGKDSEGNIFDNTGDNFIIRRDDYLNNGSVKIYDYGEFIGVAENPCIFHGCDTKNQPYDLIVASVLSLYKFHFGNDVITGTVSCKSDITASLALIEKKFGYKVQWDF